MVARPGAVAGVATTEADDNPFPCAFTPRTRIEYETPFNNPSTVNGLSVVQPSALCDHVEPLFNEIWYDKISAPLALAGLNETTNCSPSIGVSMAVIEGAPGIPAGDPTTTEDATPAPCGFRARIATWYVFPLTRPEILIGEFTV